MLPKTSRKEFVPRRHRPSEDFHRISISLPYYTQEQLAILARFIFQVAEEREIWGTNLVPFNDLKSFHAYIQEVPWGLKPLRIPFKDLPKHIHISDDIPYDPYNYIWKIPVVRWRLQIGR